MSLHADLTSVMSTLDQLLERIDEAGESLEGAARENLLGDLYEIERHLKAASRRLARAIDYTAG